MNRFPNTVTRAFLRIVYWAGLVFCFIFRPAFKAAIVAIWSGDRILIVKNSYYSKFVIPGGYVQRGEKPAEAAVREISEEVGIRAATDQLKSMDTLQGTFRFKRETIHCYELRLASPPDVHLDFKEVVWYDFLPLEKALDMNLSGPVKFFLKKYLNR